ncbi:MAG: hypothetical protein JWO41_212 [Candidatus Saccharibacteria bacterium]|nr:hypothetical protein [Candidatus Saccharibacteria bacterium]
MLTGLTNKIAQAYVRGTLLMVREGESNMAYQHTNSKGVTYYLNSKEVTLRGGKVQRIYYFSKDERPEATDLPAGFVVNENPRNGFLTVKRG